MTVAYTTLDQLTSAIQSQLINEIVPDTDDVSTAYINYLNLTKLDNSCAMISKELIKKEFTHGNIKDKEIHQHIKLNVDKIINTINVELFINQQLILQHEQQKQQENEKESIVDIDGTEDILIPTAADKIEKEEDVSELRKRLLSTSSLNNEQREELNEHHENLQQEVMSDISTLVGYIKTGALRLQQGLENEKDLLHKTEENLSKTQSSFNLNMLNLSNFNKAGRLGYWEMFKILAVFLVLVAFTMFIVSIF